MKPAHFRITYDGPALINHEMEVRELAPALLAVGDLIEQANHVLNGPDVHVSVNIKGSFKTGSFDIDFTVVQKGISYMVELLSGKGVVAGAVLLSYLGFNGKDVTRGVVGIIKWVGKRKITKVETEENKAIIYVDDDFLETELQVLSLLQDYKTRKELENVIFTPLSKEGVDSFSSGSDKNIAATVSSKEADLFKAPELLDEQIEDVSYDTTVQVARIEWSENNMWRFTDGETSFYATIKDEKFITSIQKNEIAFAKDDILKVRVHKRQWLAASGVKSEYSIEKVHSHRSAARQIPLPLKHEKSVPRQIYKRQIRLKGKPDTDNQNI